MAVIQNTLGGSGSYTMGAVTGDVALFTTPAATANTIFVVYITIQLGSLINNLTTTKLMVGPSTTVRWPDNSGYSSTVLTWNYVGMEIQ